MHTATVLEKTNCHSWYANKGFLWERKMSPEKFFLSLYIFGEHNSPLSGYYALSKLWPESSQRSWRRGFSTHFYESMAVPLGFSHPISWPCYEVCTFGMLWYVPPHMRFCINESLYTSASQMATEYQRVSLAPATLLNDRTTQSCSCNRSTTDPLSFSLALFSEPALFLIQREAGDGSDFSASPEFSLQKTSKTA